MTDATPNAASAGPFAAGTEAGAPDDVALREAMNRVRIEVGKAVVGQDGTVTGLLIALLARGHVLLEGVPGVAKTLLVRAFSAALGLDTKRIQFTPDLMPGDVSGSLVYDARAGEFEFREGPVFTNIVLADEINRTPPKTQSALLEAMEERQVSTDGVTRALADPFLVAATQNPIEQEGTYTLPEAQLDRFLLKVLIGYLSHADEVSMVTAVSTGRAAAHFDLSQVRPVLSAEDIVAMQLGTALVTVDAAVIDYAVRIVAATRKWPGIALGAGPRGSLALVRAARAQAVLSGRDFVTPDDIRTIARPALRHRIALSPEMQIEGQSNDQVLDALLAKVEAPRQ
jgi:MoxR-like ATPase